LPICPERHLDQLGGTHRTASRTHFCAELLRPLAKLAFV
jgi:hypothetical protein